MNGDETQRFCAYCKEHVHNLETLSAPERLALLTSPAAKICSRYKIAIRRSAPGKEESYTLHLLKYGAGVALTGSVLFVLWEMHDQSNRHKFYRTAARNPGTGLTMPSEFYQEYEAVAVGALAILPAPNDKIEAPFLEPDVPQHIDLKFDPAEVDKLLNQIKPTAPEVKPVIPIKPE